MLLYVQENATFGSNESLEEFRMLSKTVPWAVVIRFFTYVIFLNTVMSHMLKRQCHEIFDLYFFHESNPSGPLINRLKWFCLKIRFREDIRIPSSKNSTQRSVILRRVENF